MIIKEDLCAIQSFNEEKVRAVFDAAYTRVFQEVAGAGLVSADLIINSIEEQVTQHLHAMVTEACAELDW